MVDFQNVVGRNIPFPPPKANCQGNACGSRNETVRVEFQEWMATVRYVSGTYITKKNIGLQFLASSLSKSVRFSCASPWLYRGILIA